MTRAGAEEPANAAEPRHAWVYESIVEAVPGVRVSTRVALAAQFLGFEAAVLALAWLYRLPIEGVVAGTVAVAVASAGSAAMTAIAAAVRSGDAAPTYRRVLFGSRVEVVLGLLAYVGLLTYLFVVDPRSPPGLLTVLLGESPPAPAVYVLLLVLWDLCYRIGAAWWASVTALWRSVRWPAEGATAAALRRADLCTLAFGLLQLALVPFVLAQPFLLVALVGHVAAVVVVTTAAVATQN